MSQTQVPRLLWLLFALLFVSIEGFQLPVQQHRYGIQRRYRQCVILTPVVMSATPTAATIGEVPKMGTITLVGAGPGDPDLLTVGAARVLAKKDCLVIADRLVSTEVLATVQGQLRIARKLPGCAESAQQEIYRWTEEAVRNGTDVVRLKIGDPYVFGRGSEEVLEFRRRLGIEAHVVPGVSAVFSSPLLGGIPVTHRGVANQVIMSTGYGKEYSSPALQPYHPDQTAIFLMAVGRLRDLCQRLSSEAHYPASCPVGIVERASCPDQRVVIGTVENIADLADELEVKAPATIIFGGVVHVLTSGGEGGPLVREEGPQQGLLAAAK